MMNILKKASVSIFSIVLVSGPVHAHYFDNIYLGLGWGEVDINERSYDDPEGFEFIVGMNTSEYFAFEVSYIDFDKSKSDWYTPTRAIEAETYTVGVLGKLPLTQNWDLFAKLGYHFGELDMYDGGVKVGDDDGDDIFWGLGSTYNFDNGFGVGIRYNEYSYDRNDVDFWSINLQYAF
ncbi:outer membrane beta-barrel protein [Thalassotalea aquiviva]|uniref:outer membrane beta-barrel protein n=1 Tax=Thalassotalea aquiviva TaxID=3242415 RepID=UPI00352A2A97